MPAVTLILCIHTGVSELLDHDDWGGESFPSRRAFSSSREWGGMVAAGQGRDRRHTLIRTGHGRSAFTSKFSIIVAVTKRVSARNKQVD